MCEHCERAGGIEGIIENMAPSLHEKRILLHGISLDLSEAVETAWDTIQSLIKMSQIATVLLDAIERDAGDLSEEQDEATRAMRGILSQLDHDVAGIMDIMDVSPSFSEAGEEEEEEVAEVPRG
jgi:hypothetical protein